MLFCLSLSLSLSIYLSIRTCAAEKLTLLLEVAPSWLKREVILALPDMLVDSEHPALVGPLVLVLQVFCVRAHSHTHAHIANSGRDSVGCRGLALHAI